MQLTDVTTDPLRENLEGPVRWNHLSEELNDIQSFRFGHLRILLLVSEKHPQALKAAGDELIGSRSGDSSRGVETGSCAHVCTQGRRETQGHTHRESPPLVVSVWALCLTVSIWL